MGNVCFYVLPPRYCNYPSFIKTLVAAYHLVDCDAAYSHLRYFIGSRLSQMKLGRRRGQDGETLSVDVGGGSLFYTYFVDGDAVYEW